MIDPENISGVVIARNRRRQRVVRRDRLRPIDSHRVLSDVEDQGQIGRAGNEDGFKSVYKEMTKHLNQ